MPDKSRHTVQSLRGYVLSTCWYHHKPFQKRIKKMQIWQVSEVPMHRPDPVYATCVKNPAQFLLESSLAMDLIVPATYGLVDT
jgi:hypothetical protein